MKKIIADTINYRDMKKHFEDRTNRHIQLVQKYGKKISSKDGFSELAKMVEKHDQSKFEKPEIDPYIWLTWRYRCKDDGVECSLPEGMEEKIEEATLHHILHNPHHPEFHQDKKADLPNGKDRDGIPKEMVDATKMPELDIAEMVADWCGMSEERGNTPREWADKVVNRRWKFAHSQRELIYELIDYAWKE